MTGGSDLAVLLSSLSAQLQAQEWVFVTLPDAQYGSYADLQPFASIREQEGLTLVVAKSHATQFQTQLKIESMEVFSCITLMVHSSLHAVGLTSAVSTALARENISANMIAGYYHDHIFVPCADASQAMQVLQQLAADHR